MLLQMVTVDQLVQIIRRLGMIGVDMLHFGVGLLVNEIIEQEDDGNADGNRRDDRKHAHARFQRLNRQIKAHDAEHHTAGKAEQEAYRPVGILLKHRANQTAKARAADAGDGRGQKQRFDYTHVYSSIHLYSISNMRAHMHVLSS